MSEEVLRLKTIFDTIWEPETKGGNSEQGADPMGNFLSQCAPVVYMCCGGGDSGGPEVGYMGSGYVGGCVPKF